MFSCILAQKYILDEFGEIACHKNVTGPLYLSYCGNVTDTENDPECKYFMESDVDYIPAIPGLAANKFMGMFDME